MSRRCERRASRGARPLYHQAMWTDLLATWHVHRHAFQRGCGPSTMEVWVRKTTGRSWPSHHLRRVLNAAVECGYAEINPENSSVTWATCTRFRITKFKPLPIRWTPPAVAERYPT